MVRSFAWACNATLEWYEYELANRQRLAVKNFTPWNCFHKFYCFFFKFWILKLSHCLKNLAYQYMYDLFPQELKMRRERCYAPTFVAVMWAEDQWVWCTRYFLCPMCTELTFLSGDVRLLACLKWFIVKRFWNELNVPYWKEEFFRCTTWLFWDLILIVLLHSEWTTGASNWTRRSCSMSMWSGDCSKRVWR